MRSECGAVLRYIPENRWDVFFGTYVHYHPGQRLPLQEIVLTGGPNGNATDFPSFLSFRMNKLLRSSSLQCALWQRQMPGASIYRMGFPFQQKVPVHINLCHFLRLTNTLDNAPRETPRRSLS